MACGIIDPVAARKKSNWGGMRPGAGRPRRDREVHRRSVDFDDEDDRFLREIAEERGVSVVRIIREAVAQYVKRQRKKR